MRHWHLRPGAARSTSLLPAYVVLAALVLLVDVPVGHTQSEAASAPLGPRVGLVPSPTPIGGLFYDGRTSLGPPGNTPYDIAYDPHNGETFVTEAPSYLVVLLGSPPAVIDTIFLGAGTYPAEVAYDAANDTLFVGVSPGLVVVSATTHTIVDRLNISIVPTLLTYDSANGNIYALSANLTEINGTTYTVTALGSTFCGCWNPWALVYDPVTQVVILEWSETQPLVFGGVTALNPSTGATVWERESSLDDEYQGIAVDSRNGSVYLPDAIYARMLVLNGSDGAELGHFAFSISEWCALSILPMVYDPTSSDILVSGCGGIVRSIDTTNNIVGSGIPVAGDPNAFAVNTSSGVIFTANWDTNSVAVMSANGSKVLSVLAVGGNPSAVAFDSANATAYVLGSNNVSVINVRDHLREGSIPVGVNRSSSVGGFIEVAITPQSILYDPVSQEVYVADSGNSTVIVISTLTNSVVATIAVAPGPMALAWDNESNEIYVACQNSTGPLIGGPPARLDVISAGTRQIVRSFSLGSIGPLGIAYVASLNEIFVDNNPWFSSTFQGPTLTAFSAATGVTVGSIPLPSNASDVGQITFDNVTGDLYIAGGSLGPYGAAPDDFVVGASNLSLVGTIRVGTDPNAIVAVPSSPYLLATAGVNAILNLVNGAIGVVTASLDLAPGSSPQAVAYAPSLNQALVADAGNDSLSYFVTSQEYAITFLESGLPLGTNWAVTLGAATQWSSGTAVSFSEWNGTYNFTVSSPGNLPWPGSGTVIVNGAAVTRSITFVRATYSVIFKESGLAAGTPWNVTLGGITTTSTTFAIFFTEPNGSYSFNVSTVAGFNVIPSTGSIVINGSFESRLVNFTAIYSPLSIALTYTHLAGSNRCGEPPQHFWAILQFNATAAGGVPPYTYLWSFGDRSTGSFLQDPRHNYTTAPDIATAEVVDRQGTRVHASVTLDFATSCPPQGVTSVSNSWVIPVAAVVVAASAAGICVFFEIGRRRDRAK
jgi:YVTN family beta-propeller protein